MCGIAGICGTGWRHGELLRMQAAQSHRGPDDAGIYIDPSGAAGLAHKRLSIIDLSPAGHQPMASVDGGLVLVFNARLHTWTQTGLSATPSEYSDSE